MSGADLQGLDEAEAARRLAQIGPNIMRGAQRRSVWMIVGGVLREPMFLLLIAASVLYLLLGDLGEGLFLTAGACLTIILIVAQEARSERALAALRRLSEPFARVVRGGVERRIPVRDLTPGDLILVGEGERLPADAMLVAGDVLTLDESALTGEAATVSKTPGPAGQSAPSAATPGEEGNACLFAGTLIVAGHGAAEIVRTGGETAMGRIGASLADIVDEPTPLQRKAASIVALLGGAALAFCVVIVLAYGLTRGDWIEAMLAGITVSIALIPEEFPMVLAIFLALGSWRLAQHKVLVRRPAVIEALGGATLLCVDKTGTLTENRMEVARLWVRDVAHEIAPDAPVPPAALALVRAASLASGAQSIDPMDRAILRLGGGAEPRRSSPARSWPLRPERLAVIQVWAGEQGDMAAAKGAPEAIFRLCRLTSDQAAELQQAVNGMASEGLRVLGVASWQGPGAFPEEPDDAVFQLEGLLGFFDPLRPDARPALEEARRAGLGVAMITGDYPATALAIARQAGIDTAGGVLTGAEIAALAPSALQARIRTVRVFARVRPDQKLRLVEAFKANGEIVAMTGDGVNDAPALESAHIGIAMGERGTDVAREAADLVLLDDSFASIVGGVRLGRRIFANLRKALTYVTAIHVPIAGLALAPIVLGLPPLLFPMHVVLLELVIDPVCSLVFEAEPSESRAMTRPPRPADESLFGWREIRLAVLQGVVILAAVLGLYVWAMEGYSAAEARGAAFAALIGGNLLLALSDASAPGVALFDPHRRAFWGIALAAVCCVTAILFLPALESIFQVATPAPELAAAALATAALSGGWFAFVKVLGSRRGPAEA